MYISHVFVGFTWQIIMEYCGGGSIADLMNTTEEALDENQIAYICREALKVSLFMWQIAGTDLYLFFRFKD